MFIRRFYSVLLISMLLFGFAFSQAGKTAKTVENLKEAVNGESTASKKYAAFAQKAREEGFIKVALLFEAASKSENVHANNHKAALEQLSVTADVAIQNYDVKTTRENLLDAINGESYEVSTMYPEMLKEADNANVNIAKLSLNYAYQTEKKHKALYQNALEMLDAGKEADLPATYYVCSTCGNTYDSVAPKRCGISMTSSDRFYVIKDDEA